MQVLEMAWQLVVEFKLLYNQVIVVHKCILDELLDAVVQVVGDLLILGSHDCGGRHIGPTASRSLRILRRR